MNKSVRNIIIFSVVTISAGFVGIGIDRLSGNANPMQGPGILLWLVSPLAASLLLRWLGGDGWKDFGIGLHLKESWLWYLAGAVAIPIIVALILVLDSALGFASLSGFAEQGFDPFLTLVGVTFLGVMAKNIFEEFAWRGYLTPRFEAIGLHPFANALLTGLIWVSWHIPYYFYFLNRAELEASATLSLPVLMVVAFITVPITALAYGELRLISKSVWPAWLMHSVGNAVTLPLLSAGFVTTSGGAIAVLLAPAEGILHALLLGLFGLFLYQRRRR